MTAQSKIRRLVLVGAVAAAFAAPTAGAAPGKYVQIGGDLVAPTQVSAYQAKAGTPESAHLVQVGGELVPPEQVSAVQARLSGDAAAEWSSDDDGVGWSTTGAELGLVAALLFAAGVLGVLWRRGRLGTA